MGVLTAVCGFDLIHENPNATNVIVTVFSIMAGFLIAVISLLGDHSILPGSWRIGELQRNGIHNRLNRQKWLFYLYLVTLAIIFAAALTGKHWPTVTGWLERFYFGSATTAFLLSFRLPAELMNIQVDRIDAVIDARRSKASKLDQN
jgi:hypothetical protein